MRAALQLFFRSAADTWFHLIGYASCNLLATSGALLGPLLVMWALDTAGAASAVIILGGLLTAVAFGPPLLLGLIQMTAQTMPYRERPELSLLTANARQLARPAWRLAAIQWPATLIIFLSLYFYVRLQSAWAAPLVIVISSLAWTWLGTLFFSSPLLLRSETGSIRTSLRNGAVAMMRYPFFTSTLLVLSLLTLGISVALIPLLVLVTPAFLAVLRTRATTWVLEKEGIIQPAPELDEEW